MKWEEQLAEFRTRASKCSIDDLLTLFTELKQGYDSADWDTLGTSSAEFALLLNELVDVCPEMVGSRLLNVLEALASRYAEEVSASELTSVHVALAAHCWRHKFVECQYLGLFSSESTDLAPLEVTDVASYFEHCYFLNSHSRNWKDAATHASLAFALSPEIQRFRHWCLAELISNGHVSPLPRTVQPNVSCSVIVELARLFNDTKREGWSELVKFCQQHEARFAEWGLDLLVRRALTTYSVLQIKALLVHIVETKVGKLLKPYLAAGLTVNELINAGLSDICEIHNNRIVPLQQPANGGDEAREWLQASALLSERLQDEVYQL